MVILIFVSGDEGLAALAAITAVSSVTLAGAVRQVILICRTLSEFETFAFSSTGFRRPSGEARAG